MRRVAFITNLCPHYRRPLFELLAERFDVDFYFHSDGSESYLSREMRTGSEYGVFDTVELRRMKIAGQPILPGLAQRLTPKRYDAVVKCLNGRLMVPFVYGLAKIRGLPFVLWTGMWHHPQTFAHVLTKPITERVYRGADAVVVYGEHVKRFLVASGVRPEEVFVAGQAVEASRFAGVEGVTSDEARALYIGQLEPRKGLDDLLEALRLIRDVPLQLRLVGSGSLEDELLAAATRDPRVELVGYVPQDSLPRELAQARCLVLPSVTTERHREPWGLVVNEAMSAGIPVIATDAVGAAAGGLVVDGRNGLVVRERDSTALAHALRGLAADAERARRLGAQAREDVTRFSYQAMAEAFELAVERAIQVRR